MIPAELARSLLQTGLDAGAAAGGHGFGGLALLAVVQGLTEFLPVSSSGHLVLAQTLLEVDEPALVVDVALHVGTLAAVLWAYRTDLGALLRDVFGGRWREPALLVLGSIPAAVAGIFGRDRLEEVFGTARMAGYGLLVTALLLLLGEWARRTRARTKEPPTEGGRDADVARDPLPSPAAAFLIGTFQALALWPGISRSGSTIAAGLVCGLRSRAAARFSFLLSIPAVAGAALLELPAFFAESEGDGLLGLALAAALAGLVGVVALRFLLAFLGRGAFAWFALYCTAAGALVLVLA